MACPLFVARSSPDPIPTYFTGPLETSFAKFDRKWSLCILQNAFHFTVCVFLSFLSRLNVSSTDLALTWTLCHPAVPSMICTAQRERWCGDMRLRIKTDTLDIYEMAHRMRILRPSCTLVDVALKVIILCDVIDNGDYGVLWYILSMPKVCYDIVCKWILRSFT